MKNPDPSVVQMRLSVRPLRGNVEALSLLKSAFSAEEGILNVGFVLSSGDILVSHDSRISESEIIEMILRLVKAA